MCPTFFGHLNQRSNDSYKTQAKWSGLVSVGHVAIVVYAVLSRLSCDFVLESVTLNNTYPPSSLTGRRPVVGIED
jgi:hypothetical protein